MINNLIKTECHHETALMALWLISCNPRAVGLIPGQGAKTRHDLGPKNQNIKQEQYCNKFHKDFKNGLQKQFKNHFLNIQKL